MRHTDDVVCKSYGCHCKREAVSTATALPPNGYISSVILCQKMPTAAADDVPVVFYHATPSMPFNLVAVAGVATIEIIVDVNDILSLMRAVAVRSSRWTAEVPTTLHDDSNPIHTVANTAPSWQTCVLLEQETTTT
eukprot:scaffold36401_cov27-Prasinocladus_malaysianus.AAC.1